MTDEEQRAIRNVLATYDAGMGPLAPPDPARIWQRLEFRRRYRPRPGSYEYRSACREAITATGSLVALIATSSWDWVGKSLLLELGGGIAVAGLLVIVARRTILLTPRD